MKLQAPAFFYGAWGAMVVWLSCATFTYGQQTPSRLREFTPEVLNRIEDLPTGRLRSRIESLPAAARNRALARLRSFRFMESDLESLHADEEGEVVYVDHFSHDPLVIAPQAGGLVAAAAAAVAVDPFPSSLTFHSKAGASNVLYLDFNGETVTGTAWNSSMGRAQIPTVVYSMDADFSTFSDGEQTMIKRVWQRVAEDFAPFDIDVTTERPPTFGTRTAHALITRSTDANGDANPFSEAGGVAYVNVFGNSNYWMRRPTWIYFDNTSNSDSAIADIISHEIGHNLGLSHDGQTGGTEYYGGHGSGNTSWAPIMGSASGRSVTQWSKGEYYLASNMEDDLAILAAKTAYRTDDHGGTTGTATALVFTGGTNIVSTTPESDLLNSNPANKGILERNTDVDVFSFTTGNGPIHLQVGPWSLPSGARVGNLDVLVELRDANGALIGTNDPASQTAAQIQRTLVAGTYFLFVRNRGTGDPLSPEPTGYNAYGSVGHYFISGHAAAYSMQLIASVNNQAWGTVSPANTTVAPGSSIQLVARPASYYQFVRWTNGAAGTNNPLTFVLNTNASVQAVFGERFTTNHPTPHWWLASYGHLNFESAVNTTGANNLPLWQSYLSGLNPNDPSSQLRISFKPRTDGTSNALSWNPASGRVYTIWCSTNPATGFMRVPGASNLPASVQSFVHSMNPVPPAAFYRIEVRRL